jgi:flagellar assembly factor FliW
MTIVTERFALAGADSVLPAHISLVADLPGLPGYTWWTLDPLDASGITFAMRSGAQEAVRLFVAAPQPFFPSYRPTISGETLESLGIDCVDDAALLTVIHPADDERNIPTANLVAPIIVASHTGRAMQTVLDDDYPLRAPLYC